VQQLLLCSLFSEIKQNINFVCMHYNNCRNQWEWSVWIYQHRDWATNSTTEESSRSCDVLRSQYPINMHSVLRVNYREDFVFTYFVGLHLPRIFRTNLYHINSTYLLLSNKLKMNQSQSYLTTVIRPVCSGVRPPSETLYQFFFSSPLKFPLNNCKFLIMGRPFWWEYESVIYSCCWASSV
jgi:hypothetical protein